MEDVCKLVSIGQDLDDCAQEAAIDVLDQLLAVNIANFLRVLQPQDRRDDIWELLLVHLAQERVRIRI